MSAAVVQYLSYGEDDRISLCIKCSDCGSEWGWSYYSEPVLTRLRAIADDHNRLFHQTTGGTR